jgi:hypothetical protein
MSSSLQNEIVTSLEHSLHPTFSFFSSPREIGDDLKLGREGMSPAFDDHSGAKPPVFKLGAFRAWSLSILVLENT